MEAATDIRNVALPGKCLPCKRSITMFTSAVRQELLQDQAGLGQGGKAKGKAGE